MVQCVHVYTGRTLEIIGTDRYISENCKSRENLPLK